MLDWGLSDLDVESTPLDPSRLCLAGFNLDGGPANMDLLCNFQDLYLPAGCNQPITKQSSAALPPDRLRQRERGGGTTFISLSFFH